MKYLSLLVLSFLLFSCTNTDKVEEKVQVENEIEATETVVVEEVITEDVIENTVEEAINEALVEEIEVIEIETERVKSEEELANSERFDPITGASIPKPE